MILAPDDTPLKARCASCHAPYVHGKPFVHAATCRQGAKGEGAVAKGITQKVKPSDAGLAAELALAERMNDAGLVGWEPQYFWALDERSAKGRPIQYRSDFAFVKQRVLVESEGGAHTVRRQYEADCRRASLAAALGWRMVRASKDMILDGTAVALIRRALDTHAAGAVGRE